MPDPTKKPDGKTGSRTVTYHSPHSGSAAHRTLSSDSELAVSPGGRGSTKPLAFPPQLRSRYKPESMIGCGGFGTVYKAHDTAIGRSVAVKVLHPELTQDKVAVSRFVQEARIAGQLEHRHIVIVYDLVHADAGPSCIIMDYLGGGNLRDMLESRGKLPLETAAAITIEILDGLRQVHALKVVHRDMKPENILLTKNGRIKIGDFGVAHLPLDDGGLVARNPAFVCGTPAYIAYEQWLGHAIDCRTDLYAVGVMFFEMVIGTRPFNFFGCRYLDDYARRIDDMQGLSAAAAQANLPDQIADILSSMLDPNPDGRFATADHTIRAINAALPGTALEAAKMLSGSPATTPEAAFEDLVRLLFIDGVLVDVELCELYRRADLLGINHVRADAIIERVRTEKMRTA